MGQTGSLQHMSTRFGRMCEKRKQPRGSTFHRLRRVAPPHATRSGAGRLLVTKAGWGWWHWHFFLEEIEVDGGVIATARGEHRNQMKSTELGNTMQINAARIHLVNRKTRQKPGRARPVRLFLSIRGVGFPNLTPGWVFRGFPGCLSFDSESRPWRGLEPKPCQESC